MPRGDIPNTPRSRNARPNTLPRATRNAASPRRKRIFVAGGFAGGSDGPRAPRAVYAYDPGSDDWSHLTDLPEGVNHAPFVHHDGRLYVVGS